MADARTPDPAPELPEQFFIAHPNAALEDLREMVRGEDLGSAEGELFPDLPHDGECRICGLTKMLTEEHLPPRGAFNKGTGRLPEIKDLLGREDIAIPDAGVPIQGGIRGFILCESCNNLTGTRWGREYQEWAFRAAAAIAAVPGGIASVDAEDAYPAWDDLTFKAVYPGRYVRQVLSMMLGISGSSALGERFPLLRRLALGGDPEPLPDPLRLYMSIVAGPMARLAGGPNGQLWADLASRTKRRVLAVDFPPLGHVMIIDGPPEPNLGVDISEFTEYAVDRRADVSFGDLPLGFTYMAWPTDYRSRGKLLADRARTED